MPDSLERYLASRGALIERALRRHATRGGARGSVLSRAMGHSLFPGGKRLRPILVLAAAEACGGRPASVLPTACAVELIHTYSLIHDDLPAMDDDEWRRGRPTNHKVFGEAMAILAGDALLSLAFELIADNARAAGVRPGAVVEACRILAAAAGPQGMVGGQADDILAQGKGRRAGEGEKRLLLSIHERKTGALITGALEAGAVLAGAPALRRSAVRRYGRALGLAFQIADDVLDVTGDKRKMGKSGSDRTNDKLTFPALHGLDRSLGLARGWARRAQAALGPLGERAWMLRELADYAVLRDR